MEAFAATWCSCVGQRASRYRLATRRPPTVKAIRRFCPIPAAPSDGFRSRVYAGTAARSAYLSGLSHLNAQTMYFDVAIHRNESHAKALPHQLARSASANYASAGYRSTATGVCPLRSPQARSSPSLLYVCTVVCSKFPLASKRMPGHKKGAYRPSSYAGFADIPCKPSRWKFHYAEC